MKNLVILILINFNLVHNLFSQKQNKYDRLISTSNSILELQDSFIYIEAINKNRFKKDTSPAIKHLYKLHISKNDTIINLTTNYGEYIYTNNSISFKYLSNDNYVQFNSKFFLNIENNIYPSHFHTLFSNIPTVYNLGFSKKKFTSPKINKLSGDSFLVIQRYKKNQKIRILSIDENLRIFKIQIVNPDTTSPDEYWQYNIYYLNNINSDSFKKSNAIGKFSNVASHKNDSIKNTQFKKINIYTEISIIGHENFVLDTNSNKLILLDYWYFGCAPCMKMMPFINQLEKNIDTSKLDIIGINSFDKPDDIAYYFNKKGYNSMQMNCNISAPLHQIVEHPTLILIDYRLNIINRWVGYSPSTCNDIESTLKILGLIKQ